MDSVDSAMSQLRRQDFLPPSVRMLWRGDYPLPIGYGQTNSQPSTVRQMLKWLDAHPGMRVLDVGSGSGWTSALLSKLTGEEGGVLAVEIIPELVETGKANCRKAGVVNVEFYQAGERVGLPDHAPYDRVLVSAAADEMPSELIAQLKVGGRMVVPVKNSIIVVDKVADGEINITEHSGYRFVPLMG